MTTRSNEVVTTFLSCSVRPNDALLGRAIEEKVLAPMGFRCFAIGRNVSLADQTDDAIKRLMGSCECLVGVATERLNATDRNFPDQTPRIATPYLLQETSMAFQSNRPFLIIKTKDRNLQGITNRNLRLEIEPELSTSGKPSFHDHPPNIHSGSRDLKGKALERRAKLGIDKLKSSVGWLSSIVVGTVALSKGIDWVLQPNSFGEFYYRDAECKRCSYREECNQKCVGQLTTRPL
ncbi:MAG: hypothetical protein ACKVQW_03995 [Pyrinomonadaceae bacterium]